MFLALLLILAILFSGSVGFSSYVTVLVITAFWYKGHHVLTIGFVLGLLSDAVTLRLFGLSSVFLMTLGLFVYALRIQMEWQRVLFICGVAVLIEVVWQLWMGDRVYWHELFGQAVVVWVLWLLRQLTARRDAVYLRA